MSPRLAIIGAGFMGEALVKGLLKNGKFGPGDISMADPDEKRRRRIEAEYGIGVFADNVRAVEGADMVALCIKGQSLDAVASTLRGAIPAACSVVSVLPGVSIETLRSKFGTAAVARLMPNLGSGIGEGFTVWTTSGEMPEVSREWVTNIVQSLGKHAHVPSERYIDLATPFAAAPAFVFLFVEALVDAAVHVGLSHELARDLVVQMVKGSALLMDVEEEHPSVLRARVTSPGGVTAESIAVLEERGFRSALLQAVLAGLRKTIDASAVSDS